MFSRIKTVLSIPVIIMGLIVGVLIDDEFLIDLKNNVEKD